MGNFALSLTTTNLINKPSSLFDGFHLDKLIMTPRGSSYFSKKDMSVGFFQLPMDKDSQNFSASAHRSIIPNGSKIQQASQEAPIPFRVSRSLLSSLIWKTCVPYLDDCILFKKLQKSTCLVFEFSCNASTRPISKLILQNVLSFIPNFSSLVTL